MPLRKRPSCALLILNGGHSSRMGTDKGSLPWDTGTLLTSLLKRSLAFPFAQTVIAANAPVDLTALPGTLYTTTSAAPLTPADRRTVTPTRAGCQLLWQLRSGTTRTLTLVTDRHRDCGPVGGLDAGLPHVVAPYVCVVSVDLPFYNFLPVRNWFYTQPLPDERDRQPVLLPVVNGTEEPLAAVYPRTLTAAVQTALAAKDYRVRRLLTDQLVWQQDEADNALLYTNTNTPKTYKDAKARAVTLKRAVPVFSIIADASHTGKTTLAVALIQKFRAAGYRVGYVKSTHHVDISPKAGSDTDVAEAAGAQVCLCPDSAVPPTQDKRDYLFALSQTLPVDIAFIESRSHGSFPALKVITGTPSARDLSLTSPCLAVVSDQELPPSSQIHTFSRSHIDAIYDFIRPFLWVPGRVVP